MAGVERNPGPSRKIWTCSVCKNVLRNNTTSVRCNVCNEWCHLRACSGLQCHRLWNASFIAPCCATRPAPPIINIQQNPRITPQPNTNMSPFKILQFNCNGLRGKIHDIIHFMDKHDILVSAIQETKLNKNTSLQTPGYTIIRCDRDRDSGGGIAFMINNRVKYRHHDLPAPAANDTTLEQQAIIVTSGSSDITLINTYIPPATSCPSGYTANIEHLLSANDCIILGDFNAHHSTWHSALAEDARGTAIADQIDQSDCGVLNEVTPTRMAAGVNSSPDITIASASLLPSTDWHTEIALSSDHIPIIVELRKTIGKVKSDRSNYTNFAKADWTGFYNHTEQKFSRTQPPSNVNTGENTFRSIIKKAARLFIPAGCYKEIRPNFPTSAAKLADERDNLRASDPNNPRVLEMSNEIRKKVNEHIRNKWRDHLKKTSFKPDSGKLWRTIKGLSNPRAKTNNVIITHNGTPIQDEKKCANMLNRLFTVHPREPDGSIRNTMRKLHALKPDDVGFNEHEVTTAIKTTKPSKALGPDGISPIMLKHLGPIGIAFLTALLNLSLSSLTIPGTWKIGRIVPLLKPNKPADQAKSYRPISILSPVAKIIETLLLPVLSEHLRPAKHQHGFRKGHSTTTALHLITDRIQNGLNQQRPNLRTVLVALDLSRAFDTVNHSVLLKSILHTTLPSTVKRWMANYMRGRQTFVEFRDSTSKHRKLKQGVPQGGVLSPLLFNYYMSNMPTPPANITMVSYADDITLLCTTSNISNACTSIREYLERLNQWLISRNLELSPEKSTATLFTTWNREMYTQLEIAVANHTIPTVNKPKILGVVFDNLLTFSEHVKQVCNRVQGRNNILKSIAGSTWGKDKETLITTYKAIGRSVINYAAPIWSPQISDTSWKKLQVAQNAALRTATGCHLMSSIDHLHEETKVLPVKIHNDLLSQQYLLRCHLPEHPCSAAVTNTPPPRSIRKSLVNRHISIVNEFIPAAGLTNATYRENLKSLHTITTENAIGNYTNPVLNCRPPQVSEDERDLPRTTRTTLAQLRSGWCRLLNNYLARIDPAIIDACPRCGGQPHDARHLFQCPSKPSNLSILTLWTKPIEAAAFLELETE